MPSSDKTRRIFAYCADCDCELDQTVSGEIGQLVLCPTNRKHLAGIVYGETGKLWIKIRNYIRRYEHQYSPAAILRRHVPRYFSDAGPYVFARFLALLVLLSLSTLDELSCRVSASFLASAIILDILVTHVGIAFVTRFPADPLRSLTFALFSFVQLAMAFAALFSALGPSFVSVGSDPFRIGAIDSCYFSWLLMTTVGWADITPSPQASFVRLIVAFQLLASLVFLATVLQVIVSWSSRHPGEIPKSAR